MTWPVILLLVLGVLSATSDRSYGARCSQETMRQCKDSVDRSIQKRINDMSRQDKTSHCNTIRGDFNCILQQTRCLSSESERRRNGDVIRNGLTYIRDGCDSLGGSWIQSSCYLSDDMKTCENSHPVSSGQFSSSTTENCRKFSDFYDCVMRTVRSRCRTEDDLLIGQYLVDKAQELAWSCQDIGSSDDRNRDRDREYDNGRGYDRYGSRSGQDRDRDRYRDDYRSRTQSDRRDDDRYGSDRNSDRGGDGITCCRDERCDTYRMQECRDSLSRTVDDRQSSYQQDDRKCRKARNDFNCLLWQTTCLPREERDRVGDVFRRARDFISRNCNSYGRWTENSCFKSSEMQRCETYLSNTRSGANYEACRSYNSFKECVMEELRRRCTREDELFQGTYLVDKAQEMAWQCSSENRDRSRGDDRSRDQYYSSSDRRGPYDYNSASAFGSIETNPPHLSDDDEMCASRLQSYADSCKRDLDEKKRQLIIENDYNIKERGHCCAYKRYRTCLLDASKRVCQQERYRVVDSLMGRYRVELQKENCRRVYDSDCDAASSLVISTLLIISLVAILMPSYFSSFLSL